MSSTSESAPGPPTENVAPRRTMLAGERTQLAWWRTGFAVLAVGLAVGKIVPHLSGEETIWPYTVLGAGFGVFAVALTLQGTRRRMDVDTALRTGMPVESDRAVSWALTIGATVLAMATTAMIIFN
ncbi:MAG: DUF202 domain-containing protein [Solirubrobacterales bacterium]